MAKNGYPPLGDDKILDPLSDLDLQGLRSRERRTIRPPVRTTRYQRPRRRKIGRFILLFLLGLGVGWFLHVSETQEERPSIISSSFAYPVKGIRLERTSRSEGKEASSIAFTLLPGETVKLQYAHETLRYLEPERRSSLWSTVLTFFLSPPTLFLKDQALAPGQELSEVVRPEESLSYALSLKSYGADEPLASFTLAVEMDAQSWLVRARAFQAPQEQKACLEAGLQNDPDNVVLLLTLSKLLWEQNETRETVEGYKKVLTLDPANIEAHKALATIYWKESPKEALEIHKKLAKIEPDRQVDHYKQIARLQERLGLPSADTYRKILSLNKDDPDAVEGIQALYAKHVDRAQELEKQGDLSGAIREMKAALSIQSTGNAKAYLAALHNNLAYALAREGKIKEAIDHYQASLKYDENATTYLNLADAHKKNKESSMALKAVEKAAALKPKDRELLKSTYLLWADLLISNKKDKEALKKLKEIHGRLPKDPQITKTLGVSYWKVGDLSNALETMRTLPPLLESAPEKERAEAFGILGDLHRSIGETEKDLNARISHYDRALKAYGQALSLNSGNKEIQKRWDEVAEERKALKIKVLQSS
jgi:tetratricopeptide (TPR) repeat protein